MNDHLNKKELIAYLDDELAQSEKKVFGIHLAACENCREQLKAIALLQDRLRSHLNEQAELATIDDKSWEQVQARLSTRTKGKSTKRGFQMRRAFIVVFAIILTFVGTLYAVVPSVRAQINELVMSYFNYELPNKQGGGGVGYGGDAPFTPFTINYLPEGFRVKGNYTGFEESPGVSTLENMFSDEERFIMLIQSSGEGLSGLPEGENIDFKEHEAVLIRDLDLEEYIGNLVDEVEDYAGVETISLNWFAGDVKIELVSNFPLDEVVNIAESLTPMQLGKRER
jgi:hypothetical protein